MIRFARSWPAKSSSSVKADCSIPRRLPKPRSKSWGLEADSGDRPTSATNQRRHVCASSSSRGPALQERGFCLLPASSPQTVVITWPSRLTAGSFWSDRLVPRGARDKPGDSRPRLRRSCMRSPCFRTETTSQRGR